MSSLTDIGVALKLTSASTAVTAVTVGINGWSIPLFGVPLTVIAMAAAGATISFAYGIPIKSRRRLFTMAVANTFLATIAVAVLPRAFGWEWVDSRLEPPLAGLVAIGARWFVPQFITLVPEVLRKLFRLEKYDSTYSGGTGGGYEMDYSDYYNQEEQPKEEPKRGRKKKVV